MKKKSAWTQFWDMSSGGSRKLKWGHIYIEAPIEEAKIIFQNRFKRNPERVSCTCCGEDYSVSEYPSLKQASGFERKCRNLKTPKDEKGFYKNDDPILRENYYLDDNEQPPKGYEIEERSPWRSNERSIPLEEYIKESNVLVIHSKDIKPEERKGKLKKEGWVWAEE